MSPVDDRRQGDDPGDGMKPKDETEFVITSPRRWIVGRDVETVNGETEAGIKKKPSAKLASRHEQKSLMKRKTFSLVNL